MKTFDIVLIALFAAIFVVLGLIVPIPVPGIAVPISAQNMGIMLAGCIIGAKRGALTFLLILLMVAVGLPILSGGRGGLVVLAGPTAGYIVGWVVGAFVTGYLAEHLVREEQSTPSQYTGFFIASLVGGIAVVYPIGIVWYAYYANVSFTTALIGNLPFIPGDIIKAVIATLVARAVLVGYPLLHRTA